MVSTFSFVVITWNSEKTIEESLLGIRDMCAAENVPCQVFVVDNGSTDETIGIIERCAESMSLSLIRLDRNRGTTVTRNMAIERCTGDIVCILDSDAILLEGSLNDISD
ncbi:MAG: glycosyltransferase family 2 protein, partial [Candidatus Latescibacteria bacterium]|nr:glycosyltransferase family 2 protein [Candidatus Latescibacterota bacterium]